MVIAVDEFVTTNDPFWIKTVMNWWVNMHSQDLKLYSNNVRVLKGWGIQCKMAIHNSETSLIWSCNVHILLNRIIISEITEVNVIDDLGIPSNDCLGSLLTVRQPDGSFSPTQSGRGDQDKFSVS